jgi:hypothetical protein
MEGGPCSQQWIIDATIVDATIVDATIVDATLDLDT